MSEIVPVVLCGGSGSRLWPLSRENHPKQFVDLGGGRTLFGEAIERGRLVSPSTPPIVLSNLNYRFFLYSELYRLDLKARIICEPMAKNTAPAIALAALSILERRGSEDGLMLVLPSDQAIGNMELFKENIDKAKSAALQDYIVTFGIYPAYPATGFGYIAKGEELGEGNFKILAFVEKPKFADAVNMIQEGGYYWNAGIFLVRPTLFLCELERHRPDIYELCLAAWQKRSFLEDIEIPDREIFGKCAACSMDYAVMEKSSRVAIRPLDVPWNDLGSWDAFFRERAKDSRNNASIGNVVFEDCSRCQAYSGKRLVAAVGVEDLSIIATEDAVLVSKYGSGEKIKNLLQTLKNRGLYHHDLHPRNYRPWGSCEIIAKGEGFLVKKVTIKPGENPVPQKSGSATRHLLVICGRVELVINGKSATYTENQCLMIPAGRASSLRNPGRHPVELIEVQTGACLEEESGQ